MERELARAIEAVVMVAEEPVTPELLGQILDEPVEMVEQACKELAASYEVDGRGFILVRVGGGYRFQSHPDQARYVERFVLEGQSARLSAAALETLAIVAYKQPISRAQVAAIRGVAVEGVMRTLEQRGYIAEVGRDPGPGQAVLFGTTREFLERLGLDTIDELPALSEFVPGPDVVESLEQGLRPDTAGTPAAGGSDRPDRIGDSAAGDDEPGADEAEPDGGRDDDALARLDASTDRLDALVDEVRTRIDAAEAAVRAREEPEEAEEAEGSDRPDGSVRPEGAEEAQGPGAPDGDLAEGPGS